MQLVGDPWWQSAAHATHCLVSHREFAAEETGGAPDWSEFDVQYFLFRDLHEAGTVTFFGSVEIFFDQLVECVERFTAAALLPPGSASGWLEEMRKARACFIEYYGCDDP